MRWYTQQGEFVKTVIGANGKEREPTIRDAKKHKYIPSVTTVLDLISKPALVNYFVVEALKAAYKNVWALKKEEKEAIAILKKISKEEGEKAANFGTKIHNHVERFLKAKAGEELIMDGAVKAYVEPVYEYIIKNNIKGESEQSIIINVDNLKIAGTIDNLDDKTIRDFKTQKTNKHKFICYPSWKWQLAGYNITTQREKAEIIAISSTEPGLIECFKFTKNEMKEAEEIFRLIVKLFYLIKGL